MKKKMKFLALVILVVFAKSAFAANASHGEIPWDLIMAQVINFTVFLTAIIFFLRKPVSTYFKNYRETFLEEASKATQVAVHAEKQKKEIEDQLKKLETTYSSKLESSKKEAQALRAKIVSEAQERSQKLISDTMESATMLFKSAEQNIKLRILNEALKSAKTELTKKVDVKESQRLHGEFLEEISVGSI